MFAPSDVLSSQTRLTVPPETVGNMTETQQNIHCNTVRERIGKLYEALRREFELRYADHIKHSGKYPNEELIIDTHEGRLTVTFTGDILKELYAKIMDLRNDPIFTGVPLHEVTSHVIYGNGWDMDWAYGLNTGNIIGVQLKAKFIYCSELYRPRDIAVAPKYETWIMVQFAKKDDPSAPPVHDVVRWMGGCNNPNEPDLRWVSHTGYHYSETKYTALSWRYLQQLEFPMGQPGYKTTDTYERK